MVKKTICLFCFKKKKIMACNSCKKKNALATTPIENDSQFKMRNTGVHQISFGSGLMISNTNMTDQLAIMFLKENPNRISLFEIYPENWKELLSNDESDKPSKGKGKSK